MPKIVLLNTDKGDNERNSSKIAQQTGSIRPPLKFKDEIFDAIEYSEKNCSGSEPEIKAATPYSLQTVYSR